jgi:hypothetical protein
MDQLRIELENLKNPVVALYMSLAILLISHCIRIIWGHDFAWPAQALIFCALILLLAVPTSLIFGLVSYLLLAHGLPRYSAVHDLLLENHILEWTCALLGLGMLLWARRTREYPDITRTASVFMLLFVAWIAASVLGMWLHDIPWQPEFRHHPMLFFQGLLLFLLASQYLHEPRRVFVLALAISLIPVLRWLLQSTTDLHLEGDTAMISALALTVSLVGAFHAPDRVMRIAFAVAGSNALAMILLTQNRATAVMALVALLTLWLTGRHKLPIFVLAIVTAAALLLSIDSPHEYWNRFQAIWLPDANHATAGLDRATVQSRLSLWKAGVEVVGDYPWLGVGPGNFANIVGFYNPDIVNLPVHNSYLAIAAETGIPGLILFSALVISILIALAGLLQAGQTEKRHTARLLLACILGFLAGAIFITRHDAPLLYLMLGGAIAMTRIEHSARAKRSAPQIP